MSIVDDRPVVVVTRNMRADDGFVRALESAGARSMAVPTVAIVPPADAGGALDEALSNPAMFDWIVFTSANAVDAVCERPGWGRIRQANARAPRVAAIGVATAMRLAHHGVPVDVVPTAGGGGRELVAALSVRAELSGVRILWPRSEIAARDVAEGLEAAGATVIDPVAYCTVSVPPPDMSRFLSELAQRRIAVVSFLSPSSVRGLAEALPGGTLGALADQTLIASLGATTSAAIEAAGGRVDIEARERTVANLAVMIMERLTNRRGDAA